MTDAVADELRRVSAATEARRVRLLEVPVEWPITWHVREVGGNSLYLAGFRDRDSAEAYIRRNGWVVMGDTA